MRERACKPEEGNCFLPEAILKTGSQKRNRRLTLLRKPFRGITRYIPLPDRKVGQLIWAQLRS